MFPTARFERLAPELKFVAAVTLRFDTPQSVGETPDGVRLDFVLHGTVEGPRLNGKFPPCAAYLLIDVDGVGTINARAPLLRTTAPSSSSRPPGGTISGLTCTGGPWRATCPIRLWGGCSF